MNALLNKTPEAPKNEVKGVDPKVENKPAVKSEPKTEPKVLPDVSAIVTPPAPKDNTKEQDNLTAEQKKYVGKTVEELFDMFGGEQKRGVISEVIRTLNSAGFTTSKIATMVGRRYQHVRNVLTEDARKAEEAKRRAAKATATPATPASK